MSLFSVEGMTEAIESRVIKGKTASFSPIKRDPFECTYTRDEVLTNPVKINFCLSIACLIARNKELPFVPIEFVCAVADMLKLDLSQGRLNATQRVAKHYKDMFADKKEIKNLGTSLTASQKEVLPFEQDERYMLCVANFPLSDLPLQELQEVFNPAPVKPVKKKATPRKKATAKK